MLMLDIKGHYYQSSFLNNHRPDPSLPGRSNLSLGYGLGGGASPYMKELAEKLAFIKAEVLSQFNTPEVSRGWSVDLLQLLTMSHIHASC